jgi:cell division protease FtsH
MTLGGYAVEEMIYGTVTTGPSSDLQSATAKAKNMVTKYGMSDKVGPRAIESAPTVTKKYSFGNEEDVHSEELRAVVDNEIERIVREQLEVARKVIRDYRPALDKIASELLKKENLERDDFEVILKEFNIPLKSGEGVVVTD